MGKSLVIVESPTKAKTINKYLGKGYVVKSSVGHIRDLPVSQGRGRAPAKGRSAAASAKGSSEAASLSAEYKAHQRLVGRMGVDPTNNWEAHYEILPNKQELVSELRRLASQADAVYLATDLDREGEAIAWHLQQSIGEHVADYHRVTFNEITQSAIEEAFRNPGSLNTDRVNAQQARRFLDRVVGYMLSPLLWAKIARGLSAGRVQSVAVRLVVEREREIRRFVPEEFWEIFAELKTEKGEGMRLQVEKCNGENFRPVNDKQAHHAQEQLETARFFVHSRTEKPLSIKPSPPFITSTLQQTASTRLGFSVKKTMRLAQRLYESGYITYMRTDSTNLSREAVEAARTYIDEKFGSEWLPDKPPVYGNRNQAQEAHEAIRPSRVTAEPGTLPAALEPDAIKLYELVWRRFVACQMPPARYMSSSVTVTAEASTDSFELKGRGRTLLFAGFTRILPASSKKQDILLPTLVDGQQLACQELDVRQLFTRPPPRFSEAALVRELEKRAIGRPSTYASITSTIQERGYVSVRNKRFYAEKIGDIVTDRLMESFQNLMDYGFTAHMEEELDLVARGEQEWKALLDKFYSDFSRRLEKSSSDAGGMRANEPVMTSITCSSCARPMQVRTAGTGVFLGCSGYALSPAERCRHTINLVHGDESMAPAGDEDDEDAEVNALRAMRRCPLCSTAMDVYLVDSGRRIHVCGNSPDCVGYELEEGSFKIKGYDGPTLVCDKCGAEMQLKTGRFGKYFGCTGSDCRNTRKLLKSGQAAPPKMDPVPMPELACKKVDDYYVLRDGASGLFLAASQFPRNRETRAPLVRELLAHRGAIDSKYRFLMEAPVEDPHGNPAIVRYSRKTGQHYVMTEAEGRASGWQAVYDQEGWRESEKKVKKSR
ncbi:MAG: type I DNA topoisomerase [Kistimonas sp.]|nr:type I DNA topoisomerase [Kistimonas sp.]